MACGCVVVGTNTGFTLDIGKNRTNMMISPPGNVQLLSENIVNVIKDNCLSEYVRSNARNTVQYLEWEKSGKKFEEVLKRFLIMKKYITIKANEIIVYLFLIIVSIHIL